MDAHVDDTAAVEDVEPTGFSVPVDSGTYLERYTYVCVVQCDRVDLDRGCILSIQPILCDARACEDAISVYAQTPVKGVANRARHKLNAYQATECMRNACM